MPEKIKSTYPRYVAIYDELLNRILTGEYPVGSQLPGENVLAKAFSVSRNTLRQALLLLHEDGYISNSQGKGSVVLDATLGKNGLESISDPLVASACEKITRIDSAISFRNVSEKNKKLFKLDSSSIIVYLTRTCFVEEKSIGCSIVLIPYDDLQKAKIAMDGDSISEYYTKILANPSVYIKSDIRLTQAREPVTSLMSLSSDEHLLMFDDVAYCNNGDALLSVKTFLLSDEYNLFIVRRSCRKTSKHEKE